MTICGRNYPFVSCIDSLRFITKYELSLDYKTAGYEVLKNNSSTYDVMLYSSDPLPIGSSSRIDLFANSATLYSRGTKPGSTVQNNLRAHVKIEIMTEQ